MLTTISKCLAVFTAAACLLFLGFAIISTAGGPNWRGDIEELTQFTFTRTVSETGTTWGLASRANTEFSPKSGMLPEMVVAARKQLRTEQDARKAELDQLLQQDSARLTAAKQLIEVDLQAIDKRINQLNADLTALNEQIVARTEAGTKLAEEISQVQADTETRREEVFRLQAQLAEVRTDKFRAEEQERRLVDLLNRVTGNIDRVEQRNRQLKQRLDSYDNPPVTAGNTN